MSFSRLLLQHALLFNSVSKSHTIWYLFIKHSPWTGHTFVWAASQIHLTWIPQQGSQSFPCFPLWIQKFGILMQKFSGFKGSPGSGGVVADDVYSGSLGPGSFVWEEVFDRHCWLSFHGLLFSLYQKTVRGLGFAGCFLEEHFQVMLFARWLTEEKNPWPAFSLWMSGYHS